MSSSWRHLVFCLLKKWRPKMCGLKYTVVRLSRKIKSTCYELTCPAPLPEMSGNCAIDGWLLIQDIMILQSLIQSLRAPLQNCFCTSPFFSVLPKLEILSLQLELNLLLTAGTSTSFENTGRDQLQNFTYKSHMKSNSQKKKTDMAIFLKFTFFSSRSFVKNNIPLEFCFF